MKLLTGNGPRACVTLVLVLTLLGLGALDVVICRGADGHLGIDTRVTSCCPSCESKVPSAGSADQGPRSFLGHPSGSATCTDTPLAQGTPAVHHHSPAGGCWVGPVTVSYPALASPVLQGPAPLLCTGSILCRLRSVTLLI